jgi:resolvase-like protein
MNTSDGNRFISYFRVSTARQGRSGLGIDAQKHAVAAYLNGRRPLAEFVEIESGTKADRPMLAQALAACRVHRAHHPTRDEGRPEGNLSGLKSTTRLQSPLSH